MCQALALDRVTRWASLRRWPLGTDLKDERDPTWEAWAESWQREKFRN